MLTYRSKSLKLGRAKYRRALIAVGFALALIVVPMQTANALCGLGGPRFTPSRHAYIYDPGYRRAPPAMRRYLRDLYRRGPVYANWKQRRRYGHGWW